MIDSSEEEWRPAQNAKWLRDLTMETTCSISQVFWSIFLSHLIYLISVYFLLEISVYKHENTEIDHQVKDEYMYFWQSNFPNRGKIHLYIYRALPTESLKKSCIKGAVLRIKVNHCGNISLEFMPEYNNCSPLSKRVWSQYLVVCLVELKPPPFPPSLLSEAPYDTFLSNALKRCFRLLQCLECF